MSKFISIFNNKGGVGKTTMTWNIADTLAQKGKSALLIDFDPQCNLSIAILGADLFKELVASKSGPKTIRSFLQGYLQNTGPGPIQLYTGEHTDKKVKLVAGDFWLNVYADSLNVGNDLLTGNGIAKFVALRTLVNRLEEAGETFDYVLIDLPPSFGGLVRSALYSSNYLVIPCTSDTFSEYCIGLIGQMMPQFAHDWDTGIKRFRANNYGSKEFDGNGEPVYAGWIFNGFDTRSNKMLRADQVHYDNIKNANNDLASALDKEITEYKSILTSVQGDYIIGAVEDMNVLMQNSLWQSIPVSKLDQHKQVDLTNNHSKWSAAQFALITKVRGQLEEIADHIIDNF